MKKILLIVILISILLLSGCLKEDIVWEDILTDEVISNITSEIDEENKIFINVIDKKKLLIPLMFNNGLLEWEYDSNYLALNENILTPIKNGTTFLTGKLNNKKHIYVIDISNKEFNYTVQYNLKINYNFISESKKIGAKMSPNKIVIHNTANTATALNEIKWLHNKLNTSSTSFHFAVDDNEVSQGIPTTYSAYHAGNPEINKESIGIEIAKSMTNDNAIKDKAIKNSTLLITLLSSNFNIELDNIITHKDASGKHCPHDILDRFGLENYYKELM